MAAHKIWAGAVTNANKNPEIAEGLATTATIKPGMLTKRVATGFAESDAAATVSNLAVFIAKEKGNHFGKLITDAHTINENMENIVPHSGDYVRVLVGASQTIAVGDGLSSGADGTFVKTTGTNVALFFAQDAVTTGAGATALVLARKA